jgi:hypothetical protein
MPPFASESRVTDLEDKHAEVMASLAEIRSLLTVLADSVAEFHADTRALNDRMNKLAARVAMLDGKREGSNGNRTSG